MIIYDPKLGSGLYVSGKQEFSFPLFNRLGEKIYLHSMSPILKQFVKWQIYHEIVCATFIAISL